MITINGKQYAKNDKEFTDTLFNSTGTTHGYYKKRKNGVLLMDMQKQPFAFVVVNKYGDQPFVVSCYNTPDGIRYMFGASLATEQTLGLVGLPYREAESIVYHIAKAAGVDVARFSYLDVDTI
jgi:hypothetical protein